MKVPSIKLFAPTTIPREEKPVKRTVGEFYLNISSYVCPNPNISANAVKSLDLNFKQNGEIHLSTQYDLMNLNKCNQPALIVRRGMPILMTVYLERSFDKEHDGFEFFAVWTDKAKVFDSEAVRIPVLIGHNLVRDRELKKWQVVTDEVSRDGQSLILNILSPDDMAVGCYSIGFIVYWKGEGSSKYFCPIDMIVLFNCFISNGSAFMSCAADREAYVLEDLGVVYLGNPHEIQPIVWKYSQFNATILSIILYLGTSIGKIPKNEWNDPMLVAKGYTKVPADLLKAKYDDDYSDGKSPYDWTGSGEVLNEWFKTKKALKYGQNIVFGAILTTIFRALGIPSRTITCFNCSMNADSSFTVNYFYSDDELIRKKLCISDGESYWNFNVWSEIWCRRNDLPGKSIGWNAVSADYGPCTVNAIKEGKIKFKYNTDIFYSYINSNICNWKVYPLGPLKLVSKDSKTLAKIICTQGVAGKRLDVTDKYRTRELAFKPKVISPEKLRESNERFNNYTVNYHLKEFKFECKPIKTVNLGNPIVIGVSLMNKSYPENLNIHLCVLLYSVYYCTNFPYKLIRAFEKTVTLEKGKGEEVQYTVGFDDYYKKLIGKWHLKCYVSVKIEKPLTEYLEYQTFPILPPSLEIVTEPPIPSLESLTQIKALLTNPTCLLINGYFYLEEIDTGNQITLPKQKLFPYESISAVFKLVPTSIGVFNLKLCFTCEELVSTTFLRVKIKRNEIPKTIQP